MSVDETFWSRRKAAVTAEREAEEQAEHEAQYRAALDGKSDAEILEELGLADPDSLGAGDDFSGFMAKSVPQHLRKRALRHLWRSNPVLACVDGLNEYDLDYTNAATDAPGVTTAYQVGKGMMKHLVELAEKAEKAEQEAELEAEQLAKLEAEQATEVEQEPVAEPEAIPAPVEPDTTDDLDAPVVVADLPPRRMKFSFDEAATAEVAT